MAQYLSAEIILVMHSEVIDATGGSHGVRDPHLLAAIAEKPRSAFGGNDLYRGVFKKAAVYLESIVNYHVFVDGNKRTGIVACARFLFVNGYELNATNHAVELLALSVATKKRGIEAIAAWLKAHTKKIRVKKVSKKDTGKESVGGEEDSSAVGEESYADNKKKARDGALFAAHSKEKALE